MTIEYFIIAFVLLLLLALIAHPISKILHLPYTTTLIITGFLVSELVVLLGFDTGIRADNYHTLVFYIFIPVLVFEAAYHISKKELLKNLFPVLFLAIIGMLLTCALTAVGLYFGINHPSGFPWIAAFLAGAILAATDPVAVIDKLNELKAPERLSVLLEGESLFNDASAIVLFGAFLSLATGSSEINSFNDVLYWFVMVFAGGAVIGIVMGFIAGHLDRLMKNSVMSSMLTLAVAYGSFLFAETLHVSGVMSTLMAAIVMSSITSKYKSFADSEVNKHFWNVLTHITNAVVFIIMGVVITVSMFEERWLAMLIAIIAVMIARAITIYGSLSFAGIFQQQPVSVKYQTVMVWGGLRGAVTLALALSLPTTLDYWWTIQSIAFGVVLFTLLVQAPTIQLLIRRAGIRT